MAGFVRRHANFRRPRAHRSGDTCAPIATPCVIASATVCCIVEKSPAWKPQAMFAEVIHGMTSASAPMRQAPNDSPMSQLRSTVRGGSWAEG